MSTRVTNITSGTATLPSPYRGVLGPGRGAILSDDVSTVLANFGGAYQIEGSWRLDVTAEPGQVAYDPAPSSSLPTYASSPTDTRPDPASLPVGSQIFDTASEKPMFVGTDQEWHNADGVLE